MITVCAWRTSPDCQPVLVADDGSHDGRVSHGICSACAALLQAEQPKRPLSAQLKDWLENDDTDLPLELLWTIQQRLEAVERVSAGDPPASCGWCHALLTKPGMGRYATVRGRQ